MRLNELTPSELLALVGLLKLVVRADGRLSDKELGTLESFGQEAGETAWMQALDGADVLRTRAAVLEHAGGVERPEAREEIVRRLHDVAGADGVAGAEAAVLEEIRALWA